MPYRSLAEFLEELASIGELARVDAPVAPLREIAEITRRVAVAGGAALLFGNVTGHETPVVANLLGSRSRFCRALGIGRIEELAERLALAVAPSEPEGWFDRLRARPPESALRRWAPRTVKNGPCQQVVRLGGDVDLGEFPWGQAVDDEPAGMITAAQFVAADPDRGRIVGRHDAVVLGADRVALCWGAHDEAAQALARPQRPAEPWPVALVLGGDPAALVAASASLATGLDRLVLAGLFRDKPLEVVRCRTVDLEVPAEADVVIEGYIDPAQPTAAVGARLTPLGTWAPPLAARAMQVTAVTHRANPVVPTLVFGRPPNEATTIAAMLARGFLPVVRQAIPELVDFALPEVAGVRHGLVAAIEQSYAGQARRVAHALWGQPGLMFAKTLVVVDAGVDVHDPFQVSAAIAAHVDPARDVFFADGPPDPSDAASSGGLTRRMGIDATAKPLPAGGGPGGWALADARTRQLVSDRWSEYGLDAHGR